MVAVIKYSCSMTEHSAHWRIFLHTELMKICISIFIVMLKGVLLDLLNAYLDLWMPIDKLVLTYKTLNGLAQRSKRMPISYWLVHSLRLSFWSKIPTQTSFYIDIDIDIRSTPGRPLQEGPWGRPFPKQVIQIESILASLFLQINISGVIPTIMIPVLRRVSTQTQSAIVWSVYYLAWANYTLHIC